MSGTLNPDTIRRRQRTQFPRSPEMSLRAEVKGVKGADDDLKLLLEKLVELAERETLFTSTLEPGRLVTALTYGGYAFGGVISVENQIAPGGVVTTYLPVVPGYTYIPTSFEYWNSLPWWISSVCWMDSDLPSPPQALWVRTPDRLTMNWGGIGGLHRFMRYTITNNHATNIAYFCASHWFTFVTDDTWKMIEDIYKAPLIEHVREQAEKKSGRPYP